jgi:hypothetical protein
MPTPIDPFQLAKKFGLALDPRLAVVDDGEKFDFQSKRLDFSVYRDGRLMGSRA